MRHEMAIAVVAVAWAAMCMPAKSNADDMPDFPVAAELLVTGKFQRCEGIAFNGEGDLYVSGNRALWRIDPDGTPHKVAEFFSNLGLAPIGDRDLLYADFGPTNAFDNGTNSDGIVWRVTPEGEKTAVAKGIGDPNFVLVLEDRSFLVSDDAVDKIYHVDTNGKVDVFTTEIEYPNGMVLSEDSGTLYVAQIFRSLRPLAIDNRIWALPLKDGKPTPPAVEVAKTNERDGNDGLAMDVSGRIYVAANAGGRVWRYDPKREEMIVIAENLPGVASLAFGRGLFDHHSLYATSTRTGNVWVIPVGISGAPMYR